MISGNRDGQDGESAAVHRQGEAAYRDQGTDHGLIHEFIDKIVVYAPKYLDGKRYQVVDIYYSGVGILRELSPEEMEEAFQNRLAKQAQGKEIPA